MTATADGLKKSAYPKPKQIELAEQIGRDGWLVFQQITQSNHADRVVDHDAIQLLRQVWLQNYYPDDQDQIRWRHDNDTPPAGQTIYSPYDPEARAGKKRSTIWIGYKAPMTETCEADYPHLIVHVETTTATVPDHALVETIHTELADKHTLPGEHLVDTGYVDALNIVTSQHDHHIDLIGPAIPDMQWQATQQTGYDLSQFVLDWQQQRATCPQGKTSLYWHEGTTRHPCPARHLCTRSKVHGRALHVRPQAEHDALQRRRQQQQTDAFRQKSGRAWREPFHRASASVRCDALVIWASLKPICSTSLPLPRCPVAR